MKMWPALAPAKSVLKHSEAMALRILLLAVLALAELPEDCEDGALEMLHLRAEKTSTEVQGGGRSHRSSHG